MIPVYFLVRQRSVMQRPVGTDKLTMRNFAMALYIRYNTRPGYSVSAASNFDNYTGFFIVGETLDI